MSFGYSNTANGGYYKSRNANDFARNAANATVRDLKAEKLAEARLLTDEGWEAYVKANEGATGYQAGLFRTMSRRRMERMKNLSVEGYAELIYWREVDLKAETEKGDEFAVSRMKENWANHDRQLKELAALVGIVYPPVLN